MQNFDNLRNDVARPLNDDVIVDADVFAFDFVFVMKSGVRNNDAADVDRLQIGNRGQRAGAADLNTDVVDACNRLFGRKFVRNCPTRRAGQKTQSFLQGNGVDLINDAVYVVRQVGTDFHQVRKISVDFLQAAAEPVVRIGRKTPFLQAFEKFGLRIPAAPGHFPPGVGKKAQIAFGRNRSVELAERAGCRIARIGKSFFVFCFIFLIQCQKIGFGHIDFAADFQHIGDAVRQLLRQLTNRLQIGGNVFAGGAVAAGGALNESSVLITGREG